MRAVRNGNRSSLRVQLTWPHGFQATSTTVPALRAVVVQSEPGTGRTFSCTIQAQDGIADGVHSVWLTLPCEETLVPDAVETVQLQVV